MSMLPGDEFEAPDGPQRALDDAAEALETVPLADELEREMALLDVRRRLLLVHAHPDDETINNGVTMARYAAQGAHVTLVTCTLGEEGEVLVPELAHLAADQDDALGQHRVGELATAMEALGVKDFRFLGGPGRFRDSGMMGLDTNNRDNCFWQADLDAAAALLVDVIREVRPQVLVTYNEIGGYGHPDHIKAHQVAMRGAELAADPAHGIGEPWEIRKIYWNAIPESWFRDALRRMKEMGAESMFDEMDPDGDIPMVVPDDLVTTAVTGPEFVSAKLAAMRAHATQIAEDGPFFALSNNLGNEVWATETYQIVRGESVPDGSERESDLFAGL